MLGPARQRGFSLVELMIAMLIGLFLALGLISYFVNVAKSTSNTSKSIHLSQELRSAMVFMAGDIGRAGFWGNARLGIGSAALANPFGAVTTFASNAANPPDCILYTYDRNLNGTLDVAAPDERFGFMLDGGAVKMRNGSTSYNCTPSTEWQALTDANSVTITGLSFVQSASAATNNSHVIVRDVRISLTGRLKADPSVTQTLIETVRIRNDLYN